MNQRLKNLPISKRLFVTFAVILAMFFATVILSAAGLFGTGRNFDSFYHESYAIADKAAALKADIEIVAKFIGYSMMAEDMGETEEYIKAAEEKIGELREGTAFMKENLKQPDDLAVVEKYDAVMKAVMEDRDTVFELAGQNRNAEAVELYFTRVRPAFVEANEYLMQIKDAAAADAAGSFASASAQKSMVTAALLVLSAVTLALTVLMARCLMKSITGPIREIESAAQQVAAGAGQMAMNAQGLAEGATEQAGTVEELTASVESVADMAENTSGKAREAYEQIRASAERAESSKQEMDKLRTAMDRINATSREIENIIGEIEDIATQTNLLSLNASIEAARAGEAGRGFAVVADQIGKLAADSAQSAVNTRELIEKSIEEIRVGNGITAATAGVFEVVIEEMKGFAEVAKESSEISALQYENLLQVRSGIEQISGVVQNNSAAAEETSATSEELSAQSENLEAQVGKFKLIR